ncbi:MAG: endonuclease MutS2 [Thermosulfidibacteraceae bacterium]|jgi:DNA mismatch repair protein MutS2
MVNHDLEKIEFYRIIDIIGEYLETPFGWEELRLAKPLRDINWIIHEFRLVEDARRLIDIGLELPFDSFEDVREFLLKSSIAGSILSPSDLIKVKNFLVLSKRFKELVGDGSSFIAELTKNLVSLPELVEEISEKIDDAGFVKDEASVELSNIRRSIRALKARVTRKLREIVNSPEYSKALQDREIHFKGERYTLAVRSEMLRSVKGIVVDVSQSGATVFVEPLAIVDLNNELVSLIGDEKKEESRILRELTSKVGNHAKSIMNNTRILGKLDVIFAKAKFMKDYQCNIPGVGLEKRIEIIDGRHPLILRSKGFESTVPISVTLNGTDRTLVITGPNMGGKTAALKTIGLLTAMALSGIPVTASRDSYFFVVDGIYVDIGDEQDIEGSLSTFAGHMLNIKRILEFSTDNSLVLIDELGTGTDPEEGSALGVAITEELHKRGSLNVITTHHNRLKLLAISVKGIQNASCEFDPETLEPRYRLIIGVVGMSNAIYIASKIGIPREIIDRARMIVGERREGEDIEIGMKFRLEAERLLEEARILRERALEELKDANINAKRILEEAVRKAEGLIERVEKEMEKLKSGGKEFERSSITGKERVVIVKDAIRDFVKNHLDREFKIEVGDLVFVKGLNVRGRVVDVKGNTLRVDTGKINMKVLVDSVELVEKGTLGSEPSSTRRDIEVNLERKRRTFFPEIDVRGLRVDEAISKIEKFLNDAILFNFSEVRIIHGKGEGILRRAIHDYLRGYPYVKSFKLADESEGGSGVTIVNLDS